MSLQKRDSSLFAINAGLATEHVEMVETMTCDRHCCQLDITYTNRQSILSRTITSDRSSLSISQSYVVTVLKPV